MVESGSTTAYMGNGFPFPNWLVYDSSLFEVTLNGKPAIFLAPAPRYGLNDEGNLSYDYIGAWLSTDVVGTQTGFDLFVNINEDGTVPPRPTVDKSTYLNGVYNEPPVGYVPNTDPTKPKYLYTTDWSAMRGTPDIGFDIYSFPRIQCAELNVTMLYDPDYSRWVIYNGEQLHNAVLEWRFKKLHDIRKSPPFYMLREFRWSYSNVYREHLLSEYVTMVPNAVDTYKCEVHARTIINSTIMNGNGVAPRYKGASICAWPNLHEQLLNNPYRRQDESFVKLPISSNINNENLVVRINNNPAWILENSITNGLNIDPFYNDYQYENNQYNAKYVPASIEATGQLTITDGNNIVKYDPIVGIWKVIEGTDPTVTVELMILYTGESGVNIARPNLFEKYGIYQENNLYNYHGFVLVNTALNTIPLPTNAETIAKYLNHEYVTSPDNQIRTVPNFENYGVDNYECYINGVHVIPTKIFNINETIASVQYMLFNIFGVLNIDVAGFNAWIGYDESQIRGQATPPSGMSYLLDGNRDDNLAMNPDTCLFNRYISTHIEWIYVGDADMDSQEPLFITYEWNNAFDYSHGATAVDGTYITYSYANGVKRASLSIAPNLTTNPGPRHSSLAMTHERDLVRGWVKSGYTGPTIWLYDIDVGDNQIGFPITIKPEPIPVPLPEGGLLLPYIFESSDLILDGNFTVNINGEHIAINASDVDIPYSLSESTDIELITAEDDLAPSAVGYTSGSDIILDDTDQYDIVITDLYGNIVYDGTGNDLEVIISDIGEDLIQFKSPLLPPPPPIEQPQ